MKQALAIVLSCALLLAGCSIRKPPNGEDYHAQGELMFEQHNYNAAIESYQRLIDQYPFSPYAEDAELKIAMAFYQMQEYTEAINALNDFQRMHPTNKNLDLASYYLAMSYYDQMHRPDQDQSNTESALEQFQLIERRFPESSFAQLAHERISVLREVLARNQLIVGDYYFRRANFRAAESRLAELMQKYPDTPVAAQALFELGATLEKEGKKYSAAQAFSAVQRHFPATDYAKQAGRKLSRLKQPIDTEEDPLKLVLAESGFGEFDHDQQTGVVVRQRSALAAAGDSTAYGTDGLPVLDRPAVKAADRAAAAPLTLRTIRLASSDPPLSVIFDVSGPVKHKEHLESGPGYSALKVYLEKVAPDSKLEHHLIFDRSIFKDCDIKSDSGGTTVTVNTVPVERFAIIPLEEPPRLLVTFTPRNGESSETSGL